MFFFSINSFRKWAKINLNAPLSTCWQIDLVSCRWNILRLSWWKYFSWMEKFFLDFSDPLMKCCFFLSHTHTFTTTKKPNLVSYKLQRIKKLFAETSSQYIVMIKYLNKSNFIFYIMNHWEWKATWNCGKYVFFFEVKNVKSSLQNLSYRSLLNKKNQFFPCIFFLFSPIHKNKILNIIGKWYYEISSLKFIIHLIKKYGTSNDFNWII